MHNFGGLIMKKKNANYTGISLNVPNELFDEFTKLSKEYNIPRTHFIILSMKQYLETSKAVSNLPNLIDELKKINDDIRRN